MTQTDAPLAHQLATFGSSLDFEALPAAVVERTKELLLDYLSVCYRGMAADSSQAARAALAPAAPGRSTVVASAEQTSAPWAALLNGTAAHALEMDDVTSKSSLHPAVAVFPAALALAEEVEASAQRLVTSAVVGYEVMMRVGNALNPASAYRRGFHPTGVAGAFGAAAASASLLNLDAPRFTATLGIAGTLASGSLEYLSDGSWTKRLNAGWAAHCGIVAARLASTGFTGPSSVLEGSLGLFHGYSDDPLPELASAGLGESFQIMTVSIKPYACCRYNHGLIDCMLQLCRDYAFALDEIEGIQLGVLSGGYLLVADPLAQKRTPRNVVDAQFSAPFAAAVALARGSAGLEDYVQANVEDPVIRGLMARTTCYRDPELDAVYPDHWPAAATIRLKSGAVLKAHQPYPLGEPENPVDRQGLVRKFRSLLGQPFADEVVARVWALGDEPLSGLMHILTTPPVL
jgi:2-methylcitrate dehydratase PrpD